MSKEIRRIVFDAEPLIAHADGEQGSEMVEQLFRTIVNGDIQGFISEVNISEVRYVLARKYDENIADTYLRGIDSNSLRRTNTDGLGHMASKFKLKYNPSLGDTFALATAKDLEAPLIVGADDDYDDIEEVEIRRFRQTADTTTEGNIASVIVSLAEKGTLMTLSGVLGDGEVTQWRVQAKDSVPTKSDGHVIRAALEPTDSRIDKGPLQIVINAKSPTKVDTMAIRDPDQEIGRENPKDPTHRILDPNEIEVVGVSKS